MKSRYSVTISMKATEQYFPVVLFIMLYKVVLTVKPLDEIVKLDYSNESYWVIHSYRTVIVLYITHDLPSVSNFGSPSH